MMNSGHVEQRSMRGRLVAVLAALTAFVLTGCGAVLNTTLTLNDDHSGTRVMVATFVNDDSDQAKQAFAKPVSAYDDSIKKHVPDELSYKGIKSDGKKMTATFELSFSNADDYLSKVKAITGNDSAESNIDMLDSPLVKGVTAKESFSSGDLLTWVGEGLVEDGVLPEDWAHENLFGGDGAKTVLKVGGKEYPSESTSMDVTQVTDKGFDDVVVSLDVKSVNKIGATVFYINQKAPGAGDRKLFDDFTQGLTKSGFEVNDSSADDIPQDLTEGSLSSSTFAYVKRAVLKPTNMDNLNKALGAAMGTDPTNLKFAAGGMSDTGQSGLEVQSNLVGSLTCAGVCHQDESERGLHATVTVPDDWGDEADQSSESESGAIVLQNTEDIQLNFNVPLKVSEEHANIELDPDGDVSYSIDANIGLAGGAADADSVNKALGKLMPKWKLTSKREGDKLKVNLHADADSVSEFSSKYGAGSPNGITVSQTDPSTFKNHGTIQVTPPEWMTNGDVTVKLTKGSFVDEGDSKTLKTSGESLDFGEFTTIRVGKVITACVIGAIVIGIVLALVLNRKKIAKRIEQRRQAAQEQQAQAQAAAGTAVWPGGQAAPPAPGQGGQDNFTGQPGPAGNQSGMATGQPGAMTDQTGAAGDPAIGGWVDGEWSESDIL